MRVALVRGFDVWWVGGGVGVSGLTCCGAVEAIALIVRELLPGHLLVSNLGIRVLWFQGFRRS